MRFECQKTGVCCRSPNLLITLTHFDLYFLYKYWRNDLSKLLTAITFYVIADEASASHLVVPEIITKHGNAVIALKKTEHGSCIFLSANNLCEIYRARPLTCRMYPITFVPVNDSNQSHEKKDVQKKLVKAPIIVVDAKNNIRLQPIYAKAATKTCRGIGKGNSIPRSLLKNMANVFFHIMKDYYSLIGTINEYISEHGYLEPIEIINVIIQYVEQKALEKVPIAEYLNNLRNFSF